MNSFNYYTTIPWPTIDVNNTGNWFKELNNLENWMNSHIGEHQQAWTYIEHVETLTIGFTKPEYKTFFLLYYNK